jgi:hypothetical protein
VRSSSSGLFAEFFIEALLKLTLSSSAHVLGEFLAICGFAVIASAEVLLEPAIARDKKIAASHLAYFQL